jgi:hypothetical protein
MKSFFLIKSYMFIAIVACSAVNSMYPMLSSASRRASNISQRAANVYKQHAAPRMQAFRNYFSGTIPTTSSSSGKPGSSANQPHAPRVTSSSPKILQEKNISTQAMPTSSKPSLMNWLRSFFTKQTPAQKLQSEADSLRETFSEEETIFLQGQAEKLELMFRNPSVEEATLYIDTLAEGFETLFDELVFADAKSDALKPAALHLFKDTTFVASQIKTVEIFIKKLEPVARKLKIAPDILISPLKSVVQYINELANVASPVPQPQTAGRRRSPTEGLGPKIRKRSYHKQAQKKEGKGWFSGWLGASVPKTVASTTPRITTRGFSTTEATTSPTRSGVTTPQEFFNAVDSYTRNGQIFPQGLAEQLPRFKSVINTTRPQQVIDVYGHSFIVEQSVLQTFLEKLAFVDVLRGFNPSKPFAILRLDQFVKKLNPAFINSLSNMINILIDNGATLDVTVAKNILQNILYIFQYFNLMQGNRLDFADSITMKTQNEAVQRIVGRLLDWNVTTGRISSGEKWLDMKYELQQKAETDFQEFLLRQEIMRNEKTISALPPEDQARINRLQKLNAIDLQRIESKELGKEFDEKYEREKAKYRVTIKI